MFKIKSLGVWVILCCLALTRASVAGNTPVTIENTVINIPDIPGQCALYENAHPIDDYLLGLMRKGYVGLAELLQLTYECEDIALMRAGDLDVSAKYWTLSLLSYVGEPKTKQRFPAVSRKDYVDAVVAGIGDNELDVSSIFSKEVMKRGDQVLKKIAGETAEVGEVRPLGILDRDSKAVYFGYIVNYKLGDGSRWVLTIEGHTIVNGWPVNTIQYVVFTGDPGELDEALKRVHAKIGSLVKANGTGI